MRPQPHRLAPGLVFACLIALIGVPAAAVNAQEASGPTIVSSAGDSIGVGAAESAAAFSAPAAGTGVTSADTSASPADLQPAMGAGGGSATESVIAPDKRTRIMATTTFPNRAVVYITFTPSGGAATSSCTGFFVGADTVATAGHCVHRGSGGSTGYHNLSSFRLYPGRNGSSIPYKCSDGSIVRAKKLWTNASWTNGGGETVDFGAIEIKRCSNGATMGNTTGWFGYLNTQGAGQTGFKDFTMGYPGDKPTGTQWASNNCSTGSTFSQCTIQVTQSRQLFYKNDTSGGQSGSPVYRKLSNCNPCAIAIHGYGFHGSTPHRANNHGARIEQNVTSFLKMVRNS